MYYVFLDIDGVLTSKRVQTSNPVYDMWAQFDPIAVQFFNWIHDTYTDVQFVLSTTWKEQVSGLMEYHWIQSSFRNAGFRGVFAKDWKTNIKDDSDLYKQDRAIQVKDYLDNHSHEDYIIFDDTPYQFSSVLKGRLILTNPSDGLLSKHMANAKSIMGTWKRK